MPRKKVGEVTKIRMDSLIDHMRALRNHSSYGILVGALGLERAKIIDLGKRAKDIQERADAFVRLDGFDTAFGLISKYANMKKTDEKDLPHSPLND